MKRQAFTMIEILVAAALMVVIFSALWGMISRSMDTRAFATAKGVAKDQVETVLRYLERDIGNSLSRFDSTSKEYVPTLKELTAGTHWKMNVPPVNGNASATVEYTYNPGDHSITRKNYGPGTPATERVIANKVDFFEMDGETNKVQVNVNIKVGVIPEGRTQKQFHEQQMLITINSAITSKDAPGADAIINNY